MGCCECHICIEEDAFTKDLGGILENIPKTQEDNGKGRESDIIENTDEVQNFEMRNIRRTPSDIKVYIMKLPDNSSEVSIMSWKNEITP